MTSHPVCRFVGPLVLDKYVKLHDPSLNHSREIPPEAVGGGIVSYSFRPEVDNDVISSMAADNVGMDVPIKFGEIFSRYSMS